MYRISPIKSIMSAFENGVSNQSKNIMFVKYYNSFEVPNENIDRIKSWGDVVLVRHKFSRNDMQTVLQPFLDTIRNIYLNDFSDQLTAREFVKKCNIYSLQQETLATYLETGIAYRNEAPVIIEVEYEISRLLGGIISMLNYISAYKKIIFIIDDIQYADYATLLLMNDLSNEQSTCNISVLASYKEDSATHYSLRDVWTMLMEKASAEKLIFDSGSTSSDIHKTKSNEEFIPVSSKADEYLIKLKNMVTFLSYQQADYYLNIIMEEADNENLKLDKEVYLDYMAIHAYCSLYLKNSSKALFICEKMAPFIDGDNYIFLYQYHYASAMAQSLMLQHDVAKKHVQQCISCAKKTNDNSIIFKAKVLHYTVTYYDWINFFFSDLDQSVDESTLKEFENNGYLNTLNYLLVFAFENDKKSFEDIVAGKKPAKYFNRAIKSGTKLGNREFLLCAYMKKIIIGSEYGFNKYVASLYKKRIALVKKDYNNDHEANMYNGLGYNCTIDEQYARANKYFNKALKINYECDNTEKCAETLYNMTFNCLVAGEYHAAISNIELIVKLMDSLEINNLFICSLAKIYGMMALCQFYIGAYYKSYSYLNKLQNSLNHILCCKYEPNYDNWDDELFYYHFVNGLIYAKEKEYDYALEEYEKAEIYKNRSVKTQFFTVTALAIEKSDAYMNLNNTSEAEKILKDAIAFCNSKGYFHKTRLLVKKLENNNEILSKWNLKITSVTKEQLNEIAYNTHVRTELRKKKTEINFLTKWQEVIGINTDSIDNLIKTSLKTMQNAYNLDGILYFTNLKNRLKSYQTTVDIPIDEKVTTSIFEYFKKSSTAFVINRDEKDFYNYSFFIDLLGEDRVATIIGIPMYTNESLDSIAILFINMHRNFTANKDRHSNDMLMILKFAFIQLRNAIEKTLTRMELEQTNLLLSKSSVTDILTGTYNRQGLKNIISSNVNNSDSDDTTSVMYLDMDYFKYYNDTFGHKIGDEILKDFATRAEKLILKKGYLIRYGGDEFIIILPKTSLDESTIWAEKFIEMFDEINDTIINLIPEGAVIPDEKRLSCSIGISSFEKWDEDTIYATFNQADEALYFVKNSTRNDYMLYTDMLKHKNM